MQMMKMTLNKLQQDPTQTPVKSRVGSRPRKITSSLDYNDEREQYMNEGSYITNIYRQIDSMLSRQFYEEEHTQFRQK